MSDDPFKIRITHDDLSNVNVPQEPIMSNLPPGQMTYGQRDWGHVGQNPTASGSSGGSIFMTAWFYLGLAGLIGGFGAWAICEPHFIDGRGPEEWGNTLMIPLLVAFMSLGYGIAESIVERSATKAIIRGILSLVLGIILGFIFDYIANVLYTIGLHIIAQQGELTAKSPALWIVRSLAWMVFGISGGLIYGIVGQSGKKILYGMLGGAIGAGIGGILFDPISLLTNGAGPSRAIGMSIFAIATGVSMGLVESALKDRWLHVASGPLAGKQFILYKANTAIGSQQNCDIYLFKDPSILPTHATLISRGPQMFLQATGPVSVNGMPVNQHNLRSGDTIQIGKYVFNYQEKGASGRN